MHSATLNRRKFLQLSASSLALNPFGHMYAKSPVSQTQKITKAIPKTREALAIIGMGTWQTFNVGSDLPLRNQRVEVLKTFFDLGGQMIDSSPMYGSSQAVLGYGLEKLGVPQSLFSADKIWTSNGNATIKQLTEIEREWRLKKFDLMQIHNLLSWREHLENLQHLKKQRKIRYLGITTSHGRRHEELERIMSNFELDFVQLTYNVIDREVEERLLPIAQEKQIAIIANRPFRGGSLLNRLQSKNAKLPSWAKDFQIHNWAQYLLKFICSHPAVTCAIPATSQVTHMQENMGAGFGLLPDKQTREKMIAHVQNL